MNHLINALPTAANKGKTALKIWSTHSAIDYVIYIFLVVLLIAYEEK